LVFNLFLLIISPGYLFSSFENFTYILGLALATMASVGICLGLSRFRLAAIECVLIITPMARALVKFVIHKIAEKRGLHCMPKSFDGVLVYGDVGLFVMESLIFRRGILSYSGGIFVFFLFQSLN
jgi:hypothetical protein